MDQWRERVDGFVPLAVVHLEHLDQAGVVQRARLIEAVLADCYGAGRLVNQQLLPATVVAGSPEYLRPLVHARPSGGKHLFLYAVDLCRSPTGQWWVVRDRTQAPSGLGYALENRLIVASLFAEPFRSLGVQRLAPSYSQLIATLAQAARTTMTDDERRARAGSPHIALLSPGPFSETYFEHAFLSRYLGLTLVEGTDLTVRGDKLYLKTLAGLERVHGLLRRLDDSFCDPVELRADSTIGVPGLLQVMRAGNVVVSNAPGSELTIESLALFSSASSIGFSSMPRISFRISWTAGAVTSVRTPLATWNGPALRRKENCELAP